MLNTEWMKDNDGDGADMEEVGNWQGDNNIR